MEHRDGDKVTVSFIGESIEIPYDRYAVMCAEAVYWAKGQVKALHNHVFRERKKKPEKAGRYDLIG
jgi:hypothetical protein